ncbi:MAG: hypothetical protein ACK4E3_08325 [Brevundimonas sp.]|uniref:hypothetical protein n=1 Tax=Brevundimonas sp. TaxID=1871086 RepID=UPI00391A0517
MRPEISPEIRPTRLATLALAALMMAAVAACGRYADLEPPRETERAQRSSTGPDVVEPGTVNQPPRQLPIDGGPSNPRGGAGNRPDR